MATPEQIDALRWFVSMPDYATAEPSADNSPLIMDLIRGGLVFRNFNATEATYDLTPAGEEAIHATAHD